MDIIIIMKLPLTLVLTVLTSKTSDTKILSYISAALNLDLTNMLVPPTIFVHEMHETSIICQYQPAFAR